jgi:hypothetical protein
MTLPNGHVRSLDKKAFRGANAAAGALSASAAARYL